MTKKEKRNTQKARILLLDVRNFLTEQRNNEKNEIKQADYNRNIERLLLAIELTMPEQ
jgi:hypothetical protein